MFFGEMKVGLPKIKKGSEYSSFLLTLLRGRVTLLGAVWSLTVLLLTGRQGDSISV